MVVRRKNLELLLSEQKDCVAHSRSNSSGSKKLSELTTSYLDDQVKQYSMDSEPAQLEAQISLIDEPLATAETIGFQLERESKAAMSALVHEENKLDKLASTRMALDSDEIDSLLSGFFDKINFSSDTQSLSSPDDKDEVALETKLRDLRAGIAVRQSSIRPSPNASFHIGVPTKKSFFKHFKVDIKAANSDLINTKLYARRMFS